MLKPSDITTQKLKTGQLKEDLPELYELKEVIENSSWHTNDSVFDHTLRVLEKLKGTIESSPERIKIHLQKKLNKNTRKQLLFLSALFHDIAKKETLAKDGETTKCLGHEERGAEKVKPILDRIDISPREKEIIVRLIKHHGEPHQIANPENETRKKDLQNLKSDFSDIFLELFLLAKADVPGGQLKENKLEEFDSRIKFLEKSIDSF